jgi:hypothetical protein
MRTYRGLLAALLAVGLAGMNLGVPAPASASPGSNWALSASGASASAASASAAGLLPPESATLPATQIVPGSVNRSTMQLRATYSVGASLAWGSGRLSGHVTITATNLSASGIDRIELNTVMAPLGGLRLGTTSVDGRTVNPTVSDQTIRVPLGGVLPAGASMRVIVRYTATLRTSTAGSSWLFARANGIADLYRWIPWVSRATTFARPNYGDPFVTPSSPAVHVVLHSDVPLRWATTGTRTALSSDSLTATFDAANVRDFVVTASRDATTRQTSVNGTTVRVVSRSGFPSASVLSAAVTALTRLEARLGPYPYSLLTISESAGGYGMEGPMTVWIPPHVASSNLAYLVTHEIAHQWFYGLVGNDQAREPFADEAMTDMAARNALGMRRASQCATARLDLSIYHYSYTCYYEVIYIQGGNLIDDARRLMGSSTFWAAIRGYLAAHRFGLVHTRQLLDAIDAASPIDFAARWRSRFPSLY